MPSPPEAPELWLVRHGETEWSRDGRHTSVTDLPLTERGIADARALASRLAGTAFDLVLSSPRQRALRTAELAGFDNPVVDVDLAEWAYGDYEGITTTEIRRSVPNWSIWTHGAAGGESLEQISVRLDRVVARVRMHGGRCLCFGHGHGLRALAARWIEQTVDAGRYLALDTGTVSVLGYEREFPVLTRWNA
jgi:broad specificity phosphatase PhoE